jgi:hypothetical protein
MTGNVMSQYRSLHGRAGWRAIILLATTSDTVGFDFGAASHAGPGHLPKRSNEHGHLDKETKADMARFGKCVKT